MYCRAQKESYSNISFTLDSLCFSWYLAGDAVDTFSDMAYVQFCRECHSGIAVVLSSFQLQITVSRCERPLFAFLQTIAAPKWLPAAVCISRLLALTEKGFSLLFLGTRHIVRLYWWKIQEYWMAKKAMNLMKKGFRIQQIFYDRTFTQRVMSLINIYGAFERESLE